MCLVKIVKYCRSRSDGGFTLPVQVYVTNVSIKTQFIVTEVLIKLINSLFIHHIVYRASGHCVGMSMVRLCYHCEDIRHTVRNTI